MSKILRFVDSRIEITTTNNDNISENQSFVSIQDPENEQTFYVATNDLIDVMKNSDKVSIENW